MTVIGGRQSAERSGSGDLPDAIPLGEFTLTVAGTDWAELTETAHAFDREVQRTFARAHPILLSLYDLIIEEFAVHDGSRRSKKKAKLNKKAKPTGWFARTRVALMTALTLATTDYSKIPERFHAVVTTVERVFTSHDHPVQVTDYRLPDDIASSVPPPDDRS